MKNDHHKNNQENNMEGRRRDHLNEYREHKLLELARLKSAAVRRFFKIINEEKRLPLYVEECMYSIEWNLENRYHDAIKCMLELIRSEKIKIPVSTAGALRMLVRARREGNHAKQKLYLTFSHYEGLLNALFLVWHTLDVRERDLITFDKVLRTVTEGCFEGIGLKEFEDDVLRRISKHITRLE